MRRPSYPHFSYVNSYHMAGIIAHTICFGCTQAMACQIEIFMVLFGALLIKSDVSASDGYNEELFGYLILVIVYIPIVSALLCKIFELSSPLVFVSPSKKHECPKNKCSMYF